VSPAALWKRWVDACTAPVDVRPFALVRILLSVAVVGDLMLLLGSGVDVVSVVFRPQLAGGLSPVTSDTTWLAALPPETGLVCFVLALLGMTATALGVGGRPVIVLAVLFYSFLGHLFPGGDRGVDHLVRTALLVLCFTNAHRCYTLGEWRRGSRSVHTTPAWPGHLLRLWLVIIYMSAGLKKVNVGGWFRLDGAPQLYKILVYPMAGRLDPAWATWRTLWPLFRVGSIVTVVWEVAAPVFLTRLAPWWGLVGIAMHVGIAMMMKLGMFSWGVLAVYPLLYVAWLRPLFDALDRRFLKT